MTLERPKNLPWWAEMLVAALLGLAGTIYVESTHTDAQNATAIATLQAQQKATDVKAHEQDDEIHYVRGRVDQIFDKLSSWEKK